MILALAFVSAYAGSFQALGQAPAADFDADAVCVKSQEDADRSRVDIYVKVPFTNLGFNASPQGFVARYRIDADISEIEDDGTLGNKLESPVWDRTVRVPNHAETTQNDRFDLTTHSLMLAPGDYLVELSLQDESSGDAFVRELPIHVRDFNRAVGISDLLVLEDYDAERNVILPSVSNRLGADQLGFSLMYEVYLDRPQSIRISRQVFQTASTISDDAEATPPVTNEMLYVDGDMTHVESSRSQHIVTIPIANFQLGQYVVRVVVEDAAGNRLDEAEERFTVDWKGLAEHIEDIDAAISQLVYIAKPKEMRHIREGRSVGEQLSRFLDFWKRRDPTPATRRNERMEEYYYRVAHANERFGTLVDGWKTDRGHVVVMFGEPDYVESHPYNFNVEPYEIWYYYRIGKRFIFVDRTGLGDYEILIPIWDERTRIR